MQTALQGTRGLPIFRQSGWRAQAVLACVAVLALLMTGASVMAHRSAQQRTAVETLQDRTRELLDTTASLKLAVLDAQRGERGFVVTGDPVFLEPYLAARPVIARDSARLRELAMAEPGLRADVANIGTGLVRLSRWQERVIGLQQQGRHADAVAAIATGEGKRMIEALLDGTSAIELHARISLRATTRRADMLARNSELYQYGLTLVGLILLVITALANAAVRRSVEAETRIREELHRRAMTDDLTGLANRRELLASLERAIASSRRNRRPLALAVLDIDHFKRINDSHGHPAGDAVIRRIALLAVEVMRGQDTVGRLGGEEFAVVLPDCSAEDALSACERLRMAVRDTDLEMETGLPIYITLSTGVAVFERSDTAETMIARADAALYAAKNGGRDQVKLAA